MRQRQGQNRDTRSGHGAGPHVSRSVSKAAVSRLVQQHPIHQPLPSGARHLNAHLQGGPQAQGSVLGVGEVATSRIAPITYLPVQKFVDDAGGVILPALLVRGCKRQQLGARLIGEAWRPGGNVGQNAPHGLMILGNAGLQEGIGDQGGCPGGAVGVPRPGTVQVLLSQKIGHALVDGLVDCNLGLAPLGLCARC